MELDPEDIYFIDYYERVGDRYLSLGTQYAGNTLPEGRVAGAPGIRIDTITASLKLLKGTREVIVEASEQKPREVFTMVVFFDPVSLPYFIHPQTRPDLIEFELSKIAVRLCKFNGFMECTLPTLFSKSEYLSIFEKYLLAAKGKGHVLDRAIDVLLKKIQTTSFPL